MNKISTQQTNSNISLNMPTKAAASARKQTLAILRQFARTYMPIAKMPGIVLN